MKKSLYIYKGIALSTFAIFAAVSLYAQSVSSATGVEVDNPSFKRNDNAMQVEMDLYLKNLKVRPNRTAVFTPVIVNGDNEQTLPAIGIYGRTRWFQHLRSGKAPVAGADQTSFRYRKRPAVLHYDQSVPYQEWMNGADLILARNDYGCCSKLMGVCSAPLSNYAEPVEVVLPEYAPQFLYVRPVAETVKTRALSGRAFIDFAANRAELQPDYRGNRTELAKITATIDSVRNDKDITVTALSIKGSASPEGAYDVNERLAKGRTEALKNYVAKLYNFGPDFIVTDYVAENWEGLREYIAASNLAHKSELLEIIDDNTLQPDTKDWRMKLRYPDEYKKLAAEVFPTLRRSDYRIEYAVRSYDDIDTIRRIMAESPQKLSLSEMFALAQTLEPGSDEYNRVFETAAILYPNDETANLNAANVAMARKDLAAAEKYLKKAGDSAEAIYARGVFAGLQGDKVKAEALLKEAGAKGAAGTEAAIEHLINSQVTK